MQSIKYAVNFDSQSVCNRFLQIQFYFECRRSSPGHLFIANLNRLTQDILISFQHLQVRLWMPLKVTGEVPAAQLHAQLVLPGKLEGLVGEELGYAPPLQRRGHHRGVHVHAVT